ncbi:M4 family metallopeptidase, partial [uncultured Chloroflexus sp.]|uniref:M4 family metallopeptidase n=1 Tax=uncultured Chloroflexus sp. TaxID=214040 RepID=UPI002631DCF0
MWSRRFVSWLAAAALIWLQIAVMLAYPPTIVASPVAFDEQPRRIFVDTLVSPHPALTVALSSATVNDPKLVALEFLRGPGASLVSVADGLDWVPLRSEQLDDLTVVRVAQYKDTVRIWGADLALQVADNAVRSMSGAFVPAVAADTKPTLDLAEAIKIATLALQNDPPRHDDEELAVLAEAFAKPRLDEHELIFFNPALFEKGNATTALAYRLVLTAPDDSASATVVIDATTGKVWLSFANYHSALNRVILDARGTNTTTGTLCYTERGPIDSPHPDCVAAFTNTGLTYDYFFTTFGRDSFDNAGATMTAVVRYGTVSNAFWNGSVRLTAFGPGFAVRDVVAHEWAHAVTQYTANLVYNGQSGALNESFSDIFGAMVDRDDWLIGEDTPIREIRNMANPPEQGQPDRVGNYVCTTSNHGGVHINSGIPNKLAYLMSEGGTFNGRTVTAIGRNATERIFYRALTASLTSTSTFVDLYNALLAAASALYGTSSTQYQATQTAAQAVELNVPPSCGGTATPDSYEPDNSAAAARLITVNGSSQSHNFHVAGDQDWVTFNAVAGTVYTIQTSGLQSRADTVLALFGNNGTLLLAQNDDHGGTLASQISWTATASAQLHVRVTNFHSVGGSNTGYNLSITSSSTPSSPDAYEPDNTLATSRTITVGGAAQRHNFHVAGDQDWVRFSATAGAAYIIETFNLGSTSDTVLELYNGSGVLLAANDDYDGTLASRIQWVAPGAGTFFVKVRHYNSARYGSTTVYDLRVVAATISGDSYEPDNTQSAARPITVNGAAQTHTFHIAGDQDWIYFDTVDGAAYVIETFNLAAGNDTVLELYDSGGALLAFNDDWSGLASRIGYTPGSAMRLFVKVRHYSSSAGNNNLRYDVRVTVTAIATADDYEPDNTAATARLITPGTLDAPNVTRHNFHIPGDQDWVRFTAIAGNFYRFETANLEDRSDTVITLLGSNGTTVLAEDDDSGEGLASRLIWYAPDSATYYLRVRHYSSGASGARTGYDLRIGTYGTPGTPDAYEPDNTLSAARPISAGSSQLHNFHVAGDQDWVYFDAVNGVSYTITTSNLEARADTVLELYNSSGTMLVSDDDGGGGWASRIVWTAPASARFYVKVRQYNRNIYGANTGYRLNILSAASDAYEPDNTLATARLITVNGAAQSHNFHVAGDQDWVFFAATAGYSYRIETLNLASCSDTVIYLYNSSGTLLAANDDGGGGWASRIDWIAPGSGNFYVKVVHYSSLAYGSCTAYDLRVTGSNISGDVYEPDNTLATARSITVNGAAQSHNFHVAGDQDWVYFDVTTGSYTIRSFNLGSCSDTVFELYNSGGVLVAWDDDSGPGLASLINYNFTSSMRLYLRVRHFSSSASGNCTQYDLEVTRSTLNPDSYEPDDTMAEARTFVVNGAGQNHNFHATSDVDWVVFRAVGGTTYTIYTYNLGAEADTVLELYNSSGTLLAFNDDGGGGWASRIVWNAPTSGNYFVKIRPFGSTGGRPTASYSFRIVTGTALSEAATES